MSRRSVNDPNTFCYICGELPPRFKDNMTPLVKKAYELYFQCHVGDQDKVWAPHFSCSKCTMNLRAWINGACKYMPFAIPMIWREPKDHSTDCYFCTTNISGFTSKFKKCITYPNVNSAIRPIPHSEEVVIPKPPTNFHFDSDTEFLHEDTMPLDTDEDYVDKHTKIPHLILQSELNDLVRDLSLTKN